MEEEGGPCGAVAPAAGWPWMAAVTGACGCSASAKGDSSGEQRTNRKKKTICQY